MPEFSDARYEKSRQSITPEARGDFTERAKSSVDIVIKKVKEIAQSIGVSKPKDKPFNTAELQVQMERDINQVLTNPAIPGIAKEKFVRDIELNANLFTSEVTLKKVEDYTKQRLEDSFGMTAGETIEENFSRMVYANFVAYVQGASAGLQHGFSEERYKTASGVEYRKGSMDVFSSEIRALDKEYGIDILSRIQAQEKNSKTFARGDLARENLYRQTMVELVKDYMRTQRAPQDGQRIISLIQTGSLTTRAKLGEKTQVNTPKGKVDIVDIVLAYKDSITGFQGREHEARDAQSIALSDGISSRVKSVLGMDQLRSEFDYISVAATKDRMQHSSLADIVIMAKHLSQITPGLGDALGVYMDSRDASTGVSSLDAKLLSVNERAITAIFAVLGLVGVGAIANRIRKGTKMIELIQSLREAIRWLPAKLDAYIASGKALTDGAIDMFKQIAKMMGGSLGKELQDIMDKYMNKTGLQMNFIPSGVKSAQSAAESVKGIKEYAKGSSLDVRLGSQVDIKITPRADGTYLVQVPGYKTNLREGNRIGDIQSTEGIVLKQGEILEVGRGPNSDTGHMRLSIPDIDGTDGISGKHMMIRIGDDGQLRIQDLRSTNGTHVKTAREKNAEPVHLKSTESVSNILDTLSSQLDRFGNNIGAVLTELKSLIKLPNIHIGGIEERINSLIQTLLSEVKNISSSSKDSIIDGIFKLRKILNIKKSPVNAIPWNIEKMNINIEGSTGKIMKLTPGQYEVEKLGLSQYMISWKEGEKSFYRVFTLDEVLKLNPTLLYNRLGGLADVIKNSSFSAKKIMESGELYSPKFIATIGGREFLVTNKIKSDGRDVVVGYTLINEKYEPRLFYFSQSGGNWHCAPGVDKDVNGFYFSKGANWNNDGYTKSTVVTDEISHLLTSLPLGGTNKSDGFMELWMNATGRVQTSDFAKHPQFDSFKNRKTYTAGSGRFMDVKSMNELNNMRIDSGFDMSFSGGFTHGPSIKHQYLGDVGTYIGRTKWNGQDVEVIFAHAKNNEANQFWIEDIKIAGTTDSFGLPNVVVNGGLLTTKPIEYDDQIPVFMRNLGLQKYGPYYYDIRQFLQNNPLIREFKRQNNIVDTIIKPEKIPTYVKSIEITNKTDEQIIKSIRTTYHESKVQGTGGENFALKVLQEAGNLEILKSRGEDITTKLRSLAQDPWGYFKKK